MGLAVSKNYGEMIELLHRWHFIEPKQVVLFGSKMQRLRTLEAVTLPRVGKGPSIKYNREQIARYHLAMLLHEGGLPLKLVATLLHKISAGSMTNMIEKHRLWLVISGTDYVLTTDLMARLPTGGAVIVMDLTRFASNIRELTAPQRTEAFA